jgi:hypothetical protein
MGVKAIPSASHDIGRRRRAPATTPTSPAKNHQSRKNSIRWRSLRSWRRRNLLPKGITILQRSDVIGAHCATINPGLKDSTVRSPMMVIQTFSLDTPSVDAEAACRRALRNVDWRELPTGTLSLEVPTPGSADVLGDLLIWLMELIPPFRRLFARLRTRTRHAPLPSRGSDAVIYGAWGPAVMVTISLHERALSLTEVTLAGEGGLPGKAAAVVSELRRSIEIQSGSFGDSQRP